MSSGSPIRCGPRAEHIAIRRKTSTSSSATWHYPQPSRPKGWFGLGDMRVAPEWTFQHRTIYKPFFYFSAIWLDLRTLTFLGKMGIFRIGPARSACLFADGPTLPSQQLALLRPKVPRNDSVESTRGSRLLSRSRRSMAPSRHNVLGRI